MKLFIKQSILIILGLGLYYVNISAAQDYWGAIAIDVQSGITGNSLHQNSKEQALKEALRSCQSQHKGRVNHCQIVHQFTNTCVAVAWSPATQEYAVGLHLEDRAIASLNARTKCGDNCKVVMQLCSQ